MATINNGFDLTAPRYIDLRSGKIVSGSSVPYSSTAEALAAVPITRRVEGLVMYVKPASEILEYEFVGGIADINLVLKPIPPTVAAALDDINSAKQDLLTAGANITIVGNTISATGSGGSADNPTVVQLGFVANIAALRASTLYTANTTGTIKQIDTLGYYNNNDGGQGKWIWNPNSIVTDDGGINIKPDAVIGAGRWERLFQGEIKVEWFGAIPDLVTLQNVKVDTGLSRIYQEKLVNVPVSLVHSPCTFTSTRLRNISGTIVLDFLPSLYPTDYNNRAAFLANYTSRTDLYIEYNGTTYPLNTLTKYAGDGWTGSYIALTTSNTGLLPLVPANTNTISCTLVEKQLLVQPLDSSITVGKTLVVEGGRLFTDFNSLPVGLNCKVTSIAGNYATITNLDISRGVLNTTSQPEGESATCFTEGTDGIANAIKYAETNGIANIQLPDGTIGLMPFFSNTWTSAITFNTVVGSPFKSPFWITKDLSINGTGINNSFLSVQYAVPNRTVVEGVDVNDAVAQGRSCWIFQCILFFLKPTLDTKQIKQFNDFTIVYPDDKAIWQPYTTFCDFGPANNYTTDRRHAQKVYINNFKQICPNYNVMIYKSNYGDIYKSGFNNTSGYTFRGLYDIGTTYVNKDVYLKTDGNYYSYEHDNYLDNALVERLWTTEATDNSEIIITNSIIDGGGFEIKNASLNGDPAIYVGKTFELNNTVLNGGASPVSREYTGILTKVASTYSFEFNEAWYSPYLHNNHVDYSYRNVFGTPIEIKKPNTHTVSAIVISGGNYSITLTSNYTDVSSTTAKAKFLPNDYNNELYIEGFYSGQYVTVTNGSPTVLVPIIATGRTLDEMQLFVGKTIILYSKIDYFQVDETVLGNKRKVQLEQWDYAFSAHVETHPITETTLDIANCEVTVNPTWRDASGYSSHPFYNTTALNHRLINFTLQNCANLYRISPESTNRKGLFYAKNIKQDAVKGVLAKYGNSPVYQPYFQVSGDVEMDNCGVFKNDFAVQGIIKNTYMKGFGFYSGYLENCTLDNINFVDVSTTTAINCHSEASILSSGENFIADNLTGSLFHTSGNAHIKNSKFYILLYPNGGDQTALLEATNVICENCEMTNYLQSISGLTAPQKILAKNAFQFINSGVQPNNDLSVGPFTQDYNQTLGTKSWLTPVTLNAAYSHGSYPFYYPVAVLENADLDFGTAAGNTLFIDARYDKYPNVVSATIDDIRISSYVNNHASDYNLLVQGYYAHGITITITPQDGSVIINNTARITSLNGAARTAGIPIKFVYSKIINKWVETP